MIIRLTPISTEKITPATAAPRGGAGARAGPLTVVGIVILYDSMANFAIHSFRLLTNAPLNTAHSRFPGTTTTQ